jgi:hypothetical protein
MDPAQTKPSGWYPDPSDASVQRWWNGISWGDQTRPTNLSAASSIAPKPAARIVDPYAPVAPTPPTLSTPTTPRAGQFRLVNPIGRAGLILGFVSIFLNFVCIPSILAIIFSAIGIGVFQKLRSSGQQVNGLGWCIAGLVMGIAETLIYVANAVN